MSTTIFLERNGTRTWGGLISPRCSEQLLHRYHSMLAENRLSWTEHHRLVRLLGSGGQGVVYLSMRRGTDHFTLPVALKIFSPERYETDHAYDEAMGRMAVVAAHVAQIQQDNLLDVHNWVDRNRIRLMEMEWVNGYDLSLLLTVAMLDHMQSRVSRTAGSIINEGDRHRRPSAAATEAGRGHRRGPRLPCGLGRAAPRGHRSRRHEAFEHHAQADGQRQDRRYRLGLRGEQSARPADLHADLRRAGGAGGQRVYAAERSGEPGLRALEMLAGRSPFANLKGLRELLEAKRTLAHGCRRFLPQEVVCNELLMGFCRGLIAPDPMRRFPAPKRPTGERRRRGFPSPTHQRRPGQRV